MPAVQFTGLASGIDSTALIKTLLDQRRRTSITPLEDKITKLKDTNNAFGELKTLLSTLKDAAYKFREVAGSAIAKSASSSDETVANVVASNAAAPGTYSLSVSQTASNGTQSFNDRFSSSTTAINSALVGTGTLTIAVGLGSEQESINVSVDSNSTLDSIASAINSSSTKATASVVNTGTTASPSYALVISGNSEGTSKGTLAISADATLTSQGLFNAATVSQARDAQFSISGVSGTITRATNSISDVVSGLSFNLQKTGTTTIGVGVDSDTTTQTVQEFVDAYNEVLEYIKDNDLISQDTDESGEKINILGALSATSIDDGVISSLRSAISGSNYSAGSEIKIFADLGLTTNRDGSLGFNSDTFSQALSKEPNSVKQILANYGETVSSVNGTLDQYIGFNQLLDSSTRNNESTVSGLEDRISNNERLLALFEQSLTQQYARLESIIGSLNNQQGALGAALGGL